MESQPYQTKILYIITQGIWGGAQRYVFDLTTHLPENFSVQVAVGEAKGPQDLQDALKRSNKPNLHLTQLYRLVRPIHPFQDLRAIFEIRQLIKTTNPDIVHLNSTKAGIIGSLATLWLHPRPKVVYTVHGWVFLEPLSLSVRKLYKFLEKHTARLKDTLIVLSEKEQRVAQNLGVPESKLTIIPLGITKPLFLKKTAAQSHLQKLSRQTKLPKVWVGTIANLFPTKGLDILINSVPTILQKNPGARFFIIGSGPAEARLKKLIVQKNLTTKVFLLGAVPNAATLLPAFDLFVLPSRKEGLPYTILEAMAAGLPIVATAVGGVSEMLSNYEARFIALPNNQAELTAAIIGALKKPIKTTPIVTELKTTIEATLACYSQL